MTHKPFLSGLPIARWLVAAIVVLAVAAPAASAQKPVKPAPPKPVAAPDSSADDDNEEGGGHQFQFGIAAGALSYDAGRDEQALGAVLRWAPTPWFSLGATPTSVRARQAAFGTLPATTRSGLTDIPVEATFSHGFAGVPWNPSLAASFGATLPVGDTASGLGSGEVGTSVSGGLGFSPAEKLWVHIGAGRSLTRYSIQSAFSSGSGWGDVSVGTTLTDKVSASAGFSSDVGAVDSTFGRSRSVEGGVSFNVGRVGTLNLTTSHGVSGVAPAWSFALGLGTAFPYLSHLGGSSPNSTLQNSFGGGTHGLPKTTGTGKGSGTTTTTGRGRGRKP